MIDLYPDQEEFIGEIRKLWPHHKRIVGYAATGFGKTRCAARIIEGYVKRGMNVCFIVPRISLIQQTAEAFRALGLTGITYLWSDYPTDMAAKITIASVDTYIRRKKRTFDLVIVDEVQHRRKTLLEWMSEHPNERYLGLTATPFPDFLGNYYTAMAKSKSMDWLIENGRLAPYDVYAPSKPDLKGLKTVNTAMGMDYKESDIAQIMGSAKLVGDVVCNWLEHGGNRLTIALCVNIMHAGYLTNEFNKHGVNAELITHHVPVNERQEIFRRTRAGITRIILSVDCLTEGFDMPEATCLINARPVKSKVRFVQGIGRILRHMEGKKAIIFDHAGSFLDPDLGFVEYIDIDELPSGSDGLDSAARITKKKKEVERAPKECSKCAYLKPEGSVVCEKCGHKPIAGENVEIDETIALESLKKNKADKPVTKSEKQRFYSELIGFWTEKRRDGKNWSAGWYAHMYKSKFGVWPRGLEEVSLDPSKEVRNFIKSQFIRNARARVK